MTHTITTTVIHHGRTPPEPFTLHGVALGPSGGAIASAEHHGTEKPRVTGMQTFPAGLAAMAAAIEKLLDDDPAARVVVDGGLHGMDLWEHLGDHSRGLKLQLFENPKPELRRFELAGRLRSLYESKGFGLAGTLRQNITLRKAIADATREDAGERPEIVALSLAVIDRRRIPRIW